MKLYIIVNHLNSGSVKMKSQVFEMLNIKYEILIQRKIRLEKNVVYFFLKHLPNINVLNKIHQLQSKIIYEPLDCKFDLSPEKYINFMKNISPSIDYFIFNSLSMKNYFIEKINPQIQGDVICHHFDKKLINHQKTSHPKFFLYLGILQKTCFTLENFKKFNITQYSIDKKNCQGVHVNFCKKHLNLHHIYTSTKLATSLILDSIFVCNKIPIYLELLGENYPFFFEENLSDFKDKIKDARRVYKDPKLLKSYLKIYSQVKEKLSPQNCAIQYQNLFNNFLNNSLIH